MENAAHLRRRYHDVELVVSCGDMPAAYLDFITSILNVPLFYVRGNHDGHYYERPPGGEDLHNRLVKFNGLTFFGLEGSIRYNNSPIQYTETDMLRTVIGAAPILRYRRWRYGVGVDILVTHSPAYRIHDQTDLPHTGFKSLLRFMEWYHPRYMLHGHVHTYDRRNTVETDFQSTHIMNINPFTLIDVEPHASQS
jgi:uncharacterized protein